MLESLHPVLRDITSPVNNKLHLVSRRGWHSGSVGSADDGTTPVAVRLALAPPRQESSMPRGASYPGSAGARTAAPSNDRSCPAAYRCIHRMKRSHSSALFRTSSASMPTGLPRSKTTVISVVVFTCEQARHVGGNDEAVGAARSAAHRPLLVR